MRSVLEIYNIGMGPDSALNIVPYRACREIYQLIVNSKQVVDHVEICFYNEYARLGKEARCEDDVRAAFEYAKFPVKFTYDAPTPPAARSPFTFDALIYDAKGLVLARHRVVSISGGNYMITDRLPQSKYTFKTFDEMNKFFKDHEKMSFLEFCSLFDPKERITKHFADCLEIMDMLCERGLKKEGTLLLDGRDIYYERKAKKLYEQALKLPQPEKDGRLIAAYSYAIGEEVPEKALMVACPTCSSTSIAFSVLKWYRDTHKDVEMEKIYDAMAGAALIASLAGQNANLAASQIGCQGPVGTACGIATAILARLMFNATMEEMGRAFEMAYEHALGLICDSVCALPIVPCIQRCANFATRALDLAIMNHSLMATEELCKLDDVIACLNDTGKDLIAKNKRLAIGGFKEHAAYSLQKKGAK